MQGVRAKRPKPLASCKLVTPSARIIQDFNYMKVVIRFRRGWWLACLEGCPDPIFMRVRYRDLLDVLWEFNVPIIAIERRR